MKHTDGPWMVGDLVENDYEPRYVEVLGNDGIKHIAKAVYGETDEEAATNAHLIAAAPELLAACKAAYEKLDNITAYHQTIFEEIYSAISKAEGES